jgi:hypothetical protein
MNYRLGALIVLVALAATIRLTGCGATAVCRDGSYSWSGHHQGTCSQHRGVARWLR